jgi:hypothetical protein
MSDVDADVIVDRAGMLVDDSAGTQVKGTTTFTISASSGALASVTPAALPPEPPLNSPSPRLKELGPPGAVQAISRQETPPRTMGNALRLDILGALDSVSAS